MSNPNNLIRPAVLNNANLPTATPVVKGYRENEDKRIDRICAYQCELAFRRFLNPNMNIVREDHVTEERFRNNLSDLDRVPDVVWGLKGFLRKPFKV